MSGGWLAVVYQLPSISGLLAIATPSLVPHRRHRDHRDELLLATTLGIHGSVLSRLLKTRGRVARVRQKRQQGSRERLSVWKPN
jgi:hypothetical protein